MTDIAIFAALSALVGLISIYGRSASLRAASFGGLVLGMLLLWYASLGIPRPQYLHVPHGTVLSFHLDEPNAIYLWLLPDGSARPLALELPWQKDVAGNLVDASERRANQGDRIKIRDGIVGSGLRTKPLFYVSHSEALPPKTSLR